MRLWLACLAALVLAGAGAAASDREHDQDRVRRDVEQGRMVPLGEIVNRAETAFDGQVIEAELENDSGPPSYEVKLVTRAGQVLKLRYDARTGALLASGDRKDHR